MSRRIRWARTHDFEGFTSATFLSQSVAEDPFRTVGVVVVDVCKSFSQLSLNSIKTAPGAPSLTLIRHRRQTAVPCDYAIRRTSRVVLDMEEKRE